MYPIISLEIHCFSGFLALGLCPIHSPSSNLRGSWLGRMFSTQMEERNILVRSFPMFSLSVSKPGNSLQSKFAFQPRIQLFALYILLLDFGIFFSGRMEIITFFLHISSFCCKLGPLRSKLSWSVAFSMFINRE